MESIGEKLRTSRESRDLTLEQVARETHIAKRYLEALEEENFSLFPGEPYLVGFLRNYSDFLGLNPQDMVSLYKNLKLQEQPVPMDELLVKRRPKTPLILGIAVLTVAIVGLLLYFFLGNRVPSAADGKTGARAPAVASTRTASRTSSSDTAGGGTEYTFAGGMTERPFHRGDAVDVRLKGNDYRLLLTDVGSSVTLSTPTGVVEIAPNTEKTIDLNGNGKADIRLFLRSISTDQSPPVAVMRLDSAVLSDTSIAAADDTGTSAGPDTQQANGAPAGDGQGGAGGGTVTATATGGAVGTASGTGGQTVTQPPQPAVPDTSQPAPQVAAAAPTASTGQQSSTQSLGASAAAGAPGGNAGQAATTGGASQFGGNAQGGGAANARASAAGFAAPQAGTSNQGAASTSGGSAGSANAATGASGNLILTASQMRPFTIDFTFKTGAMFRYTVDGAEKQERFFDAGERLTATAESQFQLWLSNAGAAVVTVSGNPISLGTAGQVATDIIRWSGPTNNGDYRLELVPVL